MKKILVLLGLLFATPVWAQGNALVVTTCGALPQAYSAGATRQPTVDVNGNLCSGSSGGGGAVTIADGADVTLGAKADAAWVSGSGTVVAILKNIATGVGNAIAAGTNLIGFVSPDPCTQINKTQVNISQIGNTQIVTGTAAKKTYICSMMIVAADAENVSVVSGTGSTCGTATGALIGGPTAATGPNLAANGGFSMGNGQGTVAVGLTVADNFCLFQSGTGRIGGVVTFVQQ